MGKIEAEYAALKHAYSLLVVERDRLRDAAAAVLKDAHSTPNAQWVTVKGTSLRTLAGAILGITDKKARVIKDARLVAISIDEPKKG